MLSDNCFVTDPRVGERLALAGTRQCKVGEINACGDKLPFNRFVQISDYVFL